MEKDIKDRISKDFGTRAEEAIALLNAFEERAKTGPRISRCIVQLAAGDIAKLKKSIQEAESDWRDVIEAESVDFEFNKPFKSE